MDAGADNFPDGLPDGGSLDGGAFDLDLLASSLRADGDDVRVLLKALVNRLAGALGDRMDIERAGGRFRKSDDIRRVSVHLGDDQLDAAVDHGRLVCTVARSSGGIRIRSTTVTLDQWLRQLLATLQGEAATSQSTRLALEALVVSNRLADPPGGGPVAGGPVGGNPEALGDGGTP